MDATTHHLADVLAYKEGRVGRLRLNRPKALHSLNRQMLRDMASTLQEWRTDPDVHIILIDHAEGRGLCAGGDVVSIARSLDEPGGAAEAFFFEEYRLNHLEYTYPKPGVAFMDGVTMGGGVGISRPCRYRVATEKTILAMPETTIGIFPDVGAGRYLSWLPGRLAQFLALTSTRLSGSECHRLGIATHYILSERLNEAKDRIIEQPLRVRSILDELCEPEVPAAPIMSRLEKINDLFESDRLGDILKALDRAAAKGDEWAAVQSATIRTRSPTACKVSLRLFRESPCRTDFTDEMRMEYATMIRLIRTHDFREGVRALLIDKDNAPQWDPATPEEVTDEMLDVLFAPLPESEAWTPFPETNA